MITFIHNNPVVIQDDHVAIDRKAHTGMLDYAANIPGRLLTVNPRMSDRQSIMDPVILPLAELPYEVLGLWLTPRHEPDVDSEAKLQQAIRDSRLVVGWGYGASRLAARFGKRYIGCFEYDLQTQIIAATSGVSNPARKAYAALKVLQTYYRDILPAMRYAFELHCNGYPMQNVARALGQRNLMYLDSRMSRSLVISEDRLKARLSTVGHRPLRLFYSGRYEKMKGALDAVVVADHCLKRGMDVEMHCYGSGSLSQAMIEVAARSDGRIVVHDAVPFEVLVQKAQEADLFVCCHIQSDPSCTYIESMGAGLPIVGYRNRMWTAMAEASGAGRVVARNSPEAIAAAIQELQESPDSLIDLSLRAMRFATDHCFEQEFRLRTDAINAALLQ